MALTAVPASKYKPKSFDRQKYNVESYQYPSDLMGYEYIEEAQVDSNKAYKYGGNYVIFYINVNNESKMLKNPDGTDNQSIITPIDTSERVKKQSAGSEYSANMLRGVNAAITAGGVVAATGLKVPTAAAATGAAANILGVEAVLANTQNSTFSRPQKRLKAAIALHVPNQLSIRYGMGWAEEETFAFNAMMQAGGALVRAVEESGKTPLMDNLKNVAKTVSSPIASKVLQSSPAGGAISAITGLAPNPMKEQVFKGVDFRTFTMDYQFAPRNQNEANNVLNIIQAFKYHMHPEFKDANNFLFLYPSEFDIAYFHSGQENMNIHRHTSCVLTEMSVNYTPNGNFNTFVGGMPTQINVSLTFKELTILTKELISQGL